LFQGGSGEEKAVNEKKLKLLLFVHSTHKKNYTRRLLEMRIYSTQTQTALTAVADVIKDSVWFIAVYCFFSVDSVKFLQLSFW